MKVLVSIFSFLDKPWRVFFLLILSLLLVTLANQLEILTIGIITKATPAFSSFSKGSPVLDSLFSFYNEIFSIEKAPLNVALVVLVSALFKAGALFFHKYTTKRLGIEVSEKLRLLYFRHLERLPFSFFLKNHIGALSSRVIADAHAISEALNSCFINYLQTPFTIISTFILCLLTSWKLTLLVFLGFPLIVLPILYLAKQIKRLSKKMQKNQEVFATVLIDFLLGIQTVKLFGLENLAEEKYAEQNAHMANLEKRAARYDVASRPIIHTIGMFFLGSSLVLGLFYFEVPLPDVLVFSGLLYIFYEPIKKFAEENAQIQKGFAAAERMLEVLAIPQESSDEEAPLKLESFNTSLEFSNVSFSYEETPILENISFSIKKGEKVALVGATGAGKSSLVQLIPRLFDPQKGTIYIDGVDSRLYSRASLRRFIGFVPQKPFLFADTIRENLTLGSSYTDEEIATALKKAHADFVFSLDRGVDTFLEESGKNLSGGQQQRLVIARALLKKASILILDEVTSALDSISEKAIRSALNELKGDVTQIIIAHRLSTIEDADTIIVLDAGRIESMGSKDFLLKNSPLFSEFFNAFHESP